MTAEPEPAPDVICGHRETRISGTWECVQPVDHPDRGHYWVRLNDSKEES